MVFVYCDLLASSSCASKLSRAHAKRHGGIEEQLAWADEDVFPPSFEIKNGEVIQLPGEAPTSFELEKLARFAFSMFRRALTFAEKEQVPVLLDY